MSGKTKNYNSIIFLTTLSVYLGLVLVGGAPQVMAYAATTKNFDIQHEIEFKDDLDNKPDDPWADPKTEVNEQSRQFIRQYARLLSSSLKNYSPEINGISYNLPGEISKAIFPALDDNLIGFLNLKADKNGLAGKLNLKSNNADSARTFSDYSDSLDFYRRDSKNKTEKVVYENTKVTFENNQVFIITNLPRASIDSLIK
jgi:hypothetical protein